MFYLAAVVGMLSYALQGVMMAGSYRRHPLWATAYRGLSLGITMAPLLLLSGATPLYALTNALPLLLYACSAAFIANWGQGAALQHLPVGIMVATVISTSVAFQCFGAYLLFGDSVTAQQICWIVLILACTVLLGLSRRNVSVATKTKGGRGILIAFGAGVLLASAFLTVVHLSRSISPFVIAWAWEFGIGIAAAMAALLRWHRHGEPPPRFKTFLLVLACAAPTVVGTGLFSYASTIGPVQILAAIHAGGIAASAVLSYLLHDEKLLAREWMLVGLMSALVVSLKLLP